MSSYWNQVRMKPTLLTALLIASTSVTVFAQAPAFDVASIKPSQPGSRPNGPPKIGAEIVDAFLEVSPNSVTLRGARLGSIIKWAYAVQEHQVSGPGFLTDRFDIVAKAGTAVPENQLRAMMQTLLAERFKLSFHRQTKEMSAYTLSVGKNGHKLKPSEGDGEAVLQPNNRMGLTVKNARISEITGMLAQPLKQPIVDMTGLTGKFDFELDIMRYVSEEMLKPKAGDAPPDIIGIGIAAIQEQLGLKIESKKIPVEILIIDHMEKVPTEN